MARKTTPGPDPERLKIDGDWDAAAGKAVNKPIPASGAPDRETRPRTKKPLGKKPKG